MWIKIQSLILRKWKYGTKEWKKIIQWTQHYVGATQFWRHNWNGCSNNNCIFTCILLFIPWIKRKHYWHKITYDCIACRFLKVT